MRDLLFRDDISAGGLFAADAGVALAVCGQGGNSNGA